MPKRIKGKWYQAENTRVIIKQSEDSDIVKGFMAAQVSDIADVERVCTAINITQGLTLEELQSLKPDRVRASNDLYEALKALTLTCPRHSYTQNELVKAHEALSKANGGK